MGSEGSVKPEASGEAGGEKEMFFATKKPARFSQ